MSSPSEERASRAIAQVRDEKGVLWPVGVAGEHARSETLDVALKHRPPPWFLHTHKKGHYS